MGDFMKTCVQRRRRDAAGWPAVWTGIRIACALLALSVAGTAGAWDRRTLSQGSPIVLSLPFDTPGCYASGSAMGAKGEPVSITRDTTATYVDAGGVVRTCQANEMRVGPDGISVEPSATNYCTASQSVGAAGWINIGGLAVVTENAAVAPDGTQTAERIALAAATGDGQQRTVYASYAGVPAGTYTFSVYLKDDSVSGTTYVSMFPTGTGGAQASVPCTVSPAAWTRCSITGAQTSVAPVYVYIGPDTRVSNQPDVQPAQTIYAWGAQLETGPVATSYIPTAGTAVTRNADQVSYTAPAGVVVEKSILNGSAASRAAAPGTMTIVNGNSRSLKACKKDNARCSP